MLCSEMSVAMWLVVVMVCAAGCGAVNGESWLSSISRNLHTEMSGVMEMAAQTNNYSKPIINATYVSRLEFDMRAMGALYNSTHMVIDFIAKKQAYPEGVVSVSGGHVEVSQPLDWRVLGTHYAGPLALLLLAALLVPALPLAGLFWCCCYWCRAGRRRRPFDRKYDACLKGLLAIILIAFLTLFLFGVVCAFSTDSQVETGLQEAPDTLRRSIRDVRTFLNATQAHARYLLVDNYEELRRQSDATLRSSGMTVSLQLGEFSRAVSVTTLHKMVQRLDAVQSDLRAVLQLTSTLRYNAERLNSGLRKVKAQLLQTLARCDQPQCIHLQEKYKIGQLDTDIQYSQMPDVTELLNNVTSLLDTNIQQEVADGQKVFRDIQLGIKRSVDEHIPRVHDAIADIGEQLASMADTVTHMANNASERVGRAGPLADHLQRGLGTHGPYRRYVGLAAAAALLLMTCLMAWGLMCGVCGKRPDVYGASDCCNKGAGSSCLLCGMVAMFVLGGGVALVLLLYCLAGLLSQRFLCDPLTEPRDNRLFSDLEQVVDLEKALYQEHRDPDFNLTSVLVGCHANYTIYKSLRLVRRLDLDELQRQTAAQVSRQVAALRPALPAGPTRPILRPAARARLRALADTGLSDFDFDRILQALETNMTSLALEGLAAQLNSTAQSVRTREGFRAVSAELEDAAAQLLRYHADLVLPMYRQTADLNRTATALRDSLRFNQSSLREAISYLLHETEQADVFLNTQGPDLLQNMTQQFAGVVTEQVEQYLEMVAHGLQHEVGRCGPLSAAFNVTRDALCRRILMPANGYWMSLSWCVLLFVPIMVVAQRLARLYLQLDVYPGPLVEAEYLYDAYADRDNVPLANAYKAEKRGGREGRARGGGGSAEGRPAGGGEGRPAGGAARYEGPALAPPGDALHARRYNDMAPKHWEEGPPRYLGPTEYERPPPYYYPGPNDRQ